MAKETLKAQVERLTAENTDLRNKLDASVSAYNALRSDFNTLAIQSKAKVGEKARNERGAGRKAALSKEAQEEVRDMHRLGMSYRAIANKIGISFSTVARACKRKEIEQ